jgi:hypothetical protein
VLIKVTLFVRYQRVTIFVTFYTPRFTESTMEFTIDEELRSLLPPLSQEEYEQLEQNILEFGCQESLIVWSVPGGDEVILLDGHNRFTICSEHNISYVTESISLVDRAAAIDWMIANQLGRRNLSAEQVLYFRGVQYQQERQGITNPEGVGGKSGKIVDGKTYHQQSELTSAKLANQYGVSEKSIRNAAKYAEAVDTIALATSPQTRRQILSGEFKLTQTATLKLAKLAEQNPAAMPDILEEVRQAPSKTAATAVVQRYISEIEEIPANKETSPLADCDPLILKLLMILAAGNKGNSG